MSCDRVVDMDLMLRVQSRINGRMAVTVRGELDYGNAEQFLDCIGRCLKPPPAALHIDLHLTTYVDSGGLSALVTAYKRAEVAGTRFVVEQPTPEVYRVLHLTGLARLFGLTSA